MERRDNHSLTEGERGEPCQPTAIVIGAGFAGIAAAHALKNASFQVVVLESRNRIGGRVDTDHSFGFPVDMGASWLHGICDENPLAPLIGRLGLPLYRTSYDNTVLFDHDLESYALFDTDGQQICQDLVKRVGDLFERVLREANKLRNEYSEDMSIARALSIVLERCPELKQEGLSQRVMQWYLCRLEGWFASDADTISLKHWDQEILLPGGHGLMVRGYRSVINTLAKGLNIHLNHRVTKVVRGKKGVEVMVENGKSYFADAAIVTIPLGVLKANLIKFEPRLPAWKEEAIARIAVGTENKIALHFANVFWPNVEFLGVVSDSAYSCSYFLNLHKATGHPALIYMPAGQLAHDIEKLSDEAASKFAFAQLREILPDASEPINYLVSHWGTDNNSLGSYTYDGVGIPRDLLEMLRIPVDNLFFAGEATCMKFTGTVHAAYSTGLRAAEECRMRVLEKYGASDMMHSANEDLDVESICVPLLISRI